MGTLPVYHYQRALDEFRRAEQPGPLLKRMSELISLLDLTTTLNSSLPEDRILEAGLLIVMGELQVQRGCLLVRKGVAGFEPRAVRGIPGAVPGEVALSGLGATDLLPAAEASAALAGLGLVTVCPIVRFDSSGGPRRTVAAMALGPRAGGAPFGPEEAAFLRSVAACAAAPLENAAIEVALREANQRLSVKVFQLHSLFDVSRELTVSFDEDHVQRLVMSTLMGHLLVSRAALFRRRPDGALTFVHGRGVRALDAPDLPAAAAQELDRIPRAVPVPSLPEGPLRAVLEAAGLAYVAPIAPAARVELVVAVGARPSGVPFGEEDGDFLATLGRQAQAALEMVQLHRVAVESQRRDREMQIAREIQRSLFPARFPDVAGFALAAESRSCYEVGGDHYDTIPIGGGRVALAVADVSGKGTPASLLMASVHAWLRALAGSAGPAEVAARLNRFLYENTQANRFVTLFYAELDPGAGRLRYVNAGHVPPIVVRSGGLVERLLVGGPVLGLLEGAVFEDAEVALGSGDLVAAVTDGATEALSVADEEFGDNRVAALLGEHAGRDAGGVLGGLLDAVEAWAGPRGCTDDLTALVLKAL